MEVEEEVGEQGRKSIIFCTPVMQELLLETKPREIQRFLKEHKEEVNAVLESLLPRGEVFRHPYYEPNTLDDYLFWINMIKAREYFQDNYSPESIEDTDSLMSFFSRTHCIAMTGKEEPRRVRRRVVSYNGMSPFGGVFPGEYRDDRKDSATFISGIDSVTRQEIIKWLQFLGSSIDFPQISERVSRDYLPVIISEQTTIVYPKSFAIPRLLSELCSSLGLLEIGVLTSEEQKVKIIGSVIQFWASAHPFPKVNHSLIMNFVNFLLKKNNLSPVPSIQPLWPIAVCMQDNFLEYFWHYYQQYNLDSEIWKKPYDSKIHGEKDDLDNILLPVKLPRSES